MTDSNQASDLADRIEALSDADFNVDKDIYKAFFADEYAERVEKLKAGPMGHRLTVYDYDGYIQVPAYTASIDAAMSLVPEWAKLTFHNHGDVRGRSMWLVSPNKRFVSGATPALALCAAAIRAQENNNG